jgi:electron transfer flavoprotein alpha subunit
VMLKPAFGGNIIAPVLSKTSPALATIRPGMLSIPESESGRQAKTVPLAVRSIRPRTHFINENIVTEGGLELEQADIVVGVGTGIGGPQNVPVIEAFANRLGAHIAATRKLVDAGWLPPQYQVGLTGRSIAPRIYISLGVGGQFNHMVGIQRAGVIVAINNNPEAPIFKHSDYGIVADWREFVEVFGQEMGQR